MKRIINFSKILPENTNSTLFRRTFTQTSSEEPLETHTTLPSLDSISSNPTLAFLSLCTNINSLKKTHSILVVHGLTNDILCQTKLVSLYSLFGNIKWARTVFDQIKAPDFYSYKVMVRGYFLHNLYSDIIRLYSCMRKCLSEYDNIVFSVMLKACSELQDLYEGKKVHCQIVKVGNPDSFVITGLVDMYGKCGEIEYSRVLFEESPERNVVSWTSMIVGYVKNDCPKEGLVLFNQMRYDFVEPNKFTLGSLLSACTKLEALHQGKWIHGYLVKIGINGNSYVVSALLDMYVKCGSVTDARSVFDELENLDLVPWTTMIVGYTHRNLPNEALMLFTDKKWANVLPNAVTITNVVSACAQSGNLNLGKNVHGLETKLGLEDLMVKNALLDMYAKCQMIEDASYIFQAILDKDVVAWNSMISGYFQNGHAFKALTLLREMRYSFALDAVTVVSTLSACATLGALWTGSALHAYAMQVGLLSSNVYVGTALLNLYTKCGDSGSARRVFNEMREKNIVTWSSMMAGYGMQGDANESIALFSEMMKENLEPNDVVFTTILSACSHTGMMAEGWKYFDSMFKEYHLVPSMKHYVCIIDLLSRAGRLDEALEVIQNMPVQADARVWGALLHGCKVHSRFDIGEVAVKKMVELQPNSAGYYVLMSNLYAADGKWEQVDEMRELMKQQGLNKSPGYSLVEMDNSHSIPGHREAASS